MNNTIKCKFAGDPSDEYCANCSGVTVLDDEGGELVATECAGYEPMPEPKNAEKPPEPPREEHDTVTKGDFTSSATATVIRAEYGTSVEVEGRWHKLYYAEERIVPSSANVEQERTALWNTVFEQIQAQVDL